MKRRSIHRPLFNSQACLLGKGTKFVVNGIKRGHDLHLHFSIVFKFVAILKFEVYMSIPPVQNGFLLALDPSLTIKEKLKSQNSLEFNQLQYWCIFSGVSKANKAKIKSHGPSKIRRGCDFPLSWHFLFFFPKVPNKQGFFVGELGSQFLLLLRERFRYVLCFSDILLPPCSRIVCVLHVIIVIALEASCISIFVIFIGGRIDVRPL